jgi:hypothetical protein
MNHPKDLVAGFNKTLFYLPPKINYYGIKTTKTDKDSS